MREMHTQQSTQNGIIDYYTYRPESNGAFSNTELETLLSELMHRKHMVVRNIFYSTLDYWGYEKCKSTKRKSDIHEVCDEPDTIDAYFTDGEKRYIFKYRSGSEIIKIIICPKDTDLSLFDDESLVEKKQQLFADA